AHEQLLMGWITGGILATRGMTNRAKTTLAAPASTTTAASQPTTVNDCWEWGGDDNNNDNHDHNYDGNSEAGRVHRDDTRREGNKGEQE
ncbi:hypothetical protein L208DRAFT_1415317, partial [Tricholoma matsutake]